MLFIHLSRRHRPCRTAIPTSDAPMTASGIGCVPNGAARRGAAPAAARTAPNPDAANAKVASQNAVLRIDDGPANARLPASSASEIRRPARPNTGVLAGGGMNVWHRAIARGAAGIRTNRIVGCAHNVASGNAGASGNDTRGLATRA